MTVTCDGWEAKAIMRPSCTTTTALPPIEKVGADVQAPDALCDGMQAFTWMQINDHPRSAAEKARKLKELTTSNRTTTDTGCLSYK